MLDRNCLHCGSSFPSSRGRKFCSPYCNQAFREANPERLCSREGCGRAHRARGLCAQHYSLERYGRTGGAQKYKVIDIPCAHCGVVMQKPKRSDRGNQFCSYRCRGDFQWKSARERKMPVHVPVPVLCAVPPDHPSRVMQKEPKYRVFVMGPCAWCTDLFTIVDQTQARYCSDRCAQNAQEARSGRFRIPPKVRQAIYVRDRWTCQLCMEPVDPDLPPSDVWAATLDHIECQSWALIPDHSPSNLRLAHRWCNSVRGDESYYSAVVLSA